MYHAFLHAVLTCHAEPGRAGGRADPAGRHRAAVAYLDFIGEFLCHGAGLVRAQQRRAVQMPPHGRDASTLVSPHESMWLGWTAVRVLCSVKSSCFDGHTRRQLELRWEQAERRCSALSPEVLPLLSLACDARGFVTGGGDGAGAGKPVAE